MLISKHQKQLSAFIDGQMNAWSRDSQRIKILVLAIKKKLN